MYIYMLSDYLKEHYGSKLYKLMLSSGFTCPNRDGKCGTMGCIFCSESGAGEFTQSSELPIDKQIESAKKISHSITGQYIAYFQNFTNTYASPEKIEQLYMPVVLRDDIAILSIATRPDCLSDEIIEVLKKLNKIKPVWIEFGLQTSNDNTAYFIRRGYPFSIYEESAKKLKNAGITIITHIILGLPNESKEDMIKTSLLAGMFSDGVKFHSLYITKNTDLEKLYNEGKISLLSEEEYIDVLCECLRVTPKNVVIHRLTGDPEKNTLVAPLWTKDKIRILKEINNALYDRNIIQGERL